MESHNRGGAEVRIALIASWAVVFIVVAQGTVSMLVQVSEELTLFNRAAGIVAGLLCAILFIVVQQRVRHSRPIPLWFLSIVFVLAAVGFFMGAWLTAALALGIFGLALTGWRFTVAIAVFISLLVAFMFTEEVYAINGLFYILVVSAVALMLYVLTRLALTVAELARARETVARLRVDEERHRISRDLHDILGRSLVAVSLRTQTAISYLDTDQKRCGEQLDEVARMVSEGQKQLRSLTRGQTVLGFNDELASAKDLFKRLQIRCTTEVPIGTLASSVDTFGARVLRECVTNLLKHSRPTWVEISVRDESSTKVLVIVNDGATEGTNSAGTGLKDLAGRAEGLGAVLEAGHVSSGRFRVIARMPENLWDATAVGSGLSLLGKDA